MKAGRPDTTMHGGKGVTTCTSSISAENWVANSLAIFKPSSAGSLKSVGQTIFFKGSIIDLPE